MAFYPSKFVVITDILDIFGKLVYERLKMKAEYFKYLFHQKFFNFYLQTFLLLLSHRLQRINFL